MIQIRKDKLDDLWCVCVISSGVENERKLGSNKSTTRFSTPLEMMAHGLLSLNKAYASYFNCSSISSGSMGRAADKLILPVSVIR